MTNKKLLEIIEFAARDEWTKLDLSLQGIKKLPKEIGRLTNLTVLWLYGNQLESVPVEIGQLKNLIVLNLSGNKLEIIPAEIGQLKNLTNLYLQNNHLKDVPAELWQLTNLRELHLGGNQLMKIPAQIGQLTNLTRLDLSYNHLESVPADLGQLTKTNLKVLWLHGNQLTNIPAELYRFKQSAPFLSESLKEWKNQKQFLDLQKDYEKLILAGVELEEALKVLKGKKGFRTWKNLRKLKKLAHSHLSVPKFRKHVNSRRIFMTAVDTVMSSPKVDDSESVVPMWLKFHGTPCVADVATAISTLDNLAALIRVFHREKAEIPAYAAVGEIGSPWQEKERQEEEARLIRVFENPVLSIKSCERLAIYKIFEGSLHLGLGKLPKWLWKKLVKLWDIIPDWKRARAEAIRMEAEAGKIRAETEKINEETKTVGPKSDVEIQQEWENLRKTEEERLLNGFEKRLKLMKDVLDMAPPEYKTLPPKAIMALLNKLISTMDDASTADRLGSLLMEEEIKRLPPIETQEIETDGPEKV
jgi:Leucine-rich repeat (LRR) protein